MDSTENTDIPLDQIFNEENSGVVTVPLTCCGETVGIAEVDMATGEVAATVIEGSILDRWSRNKMDFSFSVGLFDGRPMTAEAIENNTKEN